MKKINQNTGRSVPFFSSNREYELLKKKFHDSLDEVGMSGQIILGPKVRLFEEKLAEIIGRKFSVACASGTDAITLSLLSVGIKHGDEVIIPANSYPSVFGLALSNATPVLTDVDLMTGGITLDRIKTAITRKTKAVLVVHLYGLPVEIDKIADFCKKEKLVLIEDCAQAMGSTYGGRSVGSFGDLAIFSFYPTKNLGAFGDGGAVVTDNKNLSLKLKALRMYGERERYNSEFLGLNSRLDEIQAAFLLKKLNYFQDWVDRRRKIAEVYYAKLIQLPNIDLLPIFENRSNSFHLFPIRAKNRNELRNWLEQNKIQTGIHYPKSIHQTKTFNKLSENRKFINSELWNNTTLSLPMNPFLTDQEVEFVADKVVEFYSK